MNRLGQAEVKNLNNSLMLVTSLTPYIGYDQAARAAKKAYDENISLKQACLELKMMTADEFDARIDLKKMVKFDKQ